MVLEKRYVKSLQTEGQAEDGQQVFRKAHSNLWFKIARGRKERMDHNNMLQVFGILAVKSDLGLLRRFAHLSYGNVWVNAFTLLFIY